MPKRPASVTESIPQPSGLQIALVFAAFLGVFVVLLFLPAGRLYWLAAWLYLGILTLSMAVSHVYLRRKNPTLIAHRMRFVKGTKTWDLVWMVLFTPVFASIYLVAALDAGRTGGSAMPSLVWPLGLLLFLLGMLLLMRSMGVNPFFEKTVRIQTERGHQVIDTGPYRFVRHPGYVGFLGWIFSTPLLLGSWWALIPAMLAMVALIVRTALEDRTLIDELPGYVEYAGRVRFRMFPGIW